MLYKYSPCTDLTGSQASLYIRLNPLYYVGMGDCNRRGTHAATENQAQGSPSLSRPCRPPSCAQPRPGRHCGRQWACTSSSSRAEPGVGSNASSSVGRRRELRTRQRRHWSRSPKHVRKRWPTASWPARAATRSQKSGAPQGVPSFAEAAATVVEQQQAGWRDPKYPKIWLNKPGTLRIRAHRQDAGLGGDKR